MADLAFHKRRRGVARSSLTKLSTKLTELEGNPESPTILENANSLDEKIKALQRDFRIHQLAIIDHTDEGESLEEERQALDDNDDLISELCICIQRLISSPQDQYV